MSIPPAILLLDGFNLVFRSFYGIRELSRSDGFPTNAIHGFIKTVWKLEDLYPEALPVICFDKGGDQEREALLPSYKQNRAEMPEDLGRQLPLIERLIRLLGIPLYELEGVEADDLIATLARRYREAGAEVLIVSADKDLAQCVGPGVSQLLPPPTANPKLGWRTLDRDGVQDKFGVPPELVAEYLALIGDTSDNIPGLAGVGPKTAAKWLGTHHSLEAIIERCGTLNPKRFQQVVFDSVVQLRANLELTKLRDAIELEHIPDRRDSIDLESLGDFFREMEMTRTAEEAKRRFDQRTRT